MKEKPSNNLLKAFLVVFLFGSINREFVAFGLDIRYVGVALAILLILRYAISRGRKTAVRVRSKERKSSSTELLVTLFFLFVFLSNLFWLNNGLYFNEEIFSNLIILNAYNAFAFAVFALYREELSKEFVTKVLLLSCFVMAVSALSVYFGFHIPAAFINQDVRTESAGDSFRNLFGQSVRVAGFAEDANYATLFSVVGIALSTKYFKRGLVLKYCYNALMLVVVALAFSRTVILGSIAALVMLGVSKIVVSKKVFAWVFLLICVGTVIAVGINPPSGMIDTLQTRFNLWSFASELFGSNPIFGSGLGSVRSYISMQYGLTWFVQCHSTWWQVLSEHGVISGVLLLCIFAKAMSCEDTTARFVAILFFVLSLTYETLYLQIAIVALYLLPNVFSSEVSPSEQVQETDIGETFGEREIAIRGKTWKAPQA